MKRRTTTTVETPDELAARARREAEHKWRQATTGRTRDEAMALVNQIIAGAHLRGAKVNEFKDGWSTYVEVERGWASGATLHVNLRKSDYRGVAEPGVDVFQPVSTLRAAYPIKAQVEVTWSATNRSLTAASAAVALYREVIDLGCEIESRLGERDIYVIE